MPDVRTNALLPKGEDNGLALIAGELAAEATGMRPARLWAVLGIVDCRRVSVDADTGEEMATVRFRRVELLLPDDLPTAEKLIRRALEHRSGATTLPLEMEDEIRQAFADMTDDATDDEDQDQEDEDDAE
ncbi:MAG: hypothetical protein FWE35_10875 [Streptosporangiales bacterium]|nr:hypothetical protein [Streptosporangiales bacterium]